MATPFIQNNAEIMLENGDLFGFLPTEFWFQIIMKESLENAAPSAGIKTSTCNEKFNQSTKIQRKRQLPNWLSKKKSPISITKSKIKKLNTASTNTSPKKTDTGILHFINSCVVNINKIDDNSTNPIQFTSTSNDSLPATTDSKMSIDNTSDSASVTNPISFTIIPTNPTTSASASSAPKTGQIRVKNDIFKNDKSSGGNNIVSETEIQNHMHVPTTVTLLDERIKIEIDELSEDNAAQPLEYECGQEQPQNGEQVKKEQEDQSNSIDEPQLNTATTSTDTNTQFPVRQSCQYGIRCYRQVMYF